MSVGDEKLVRTQICLAARQIDALRKAARRRRCSVAGLIRAAVDRELERDNDIEKAMFSIVGLAGGGGEYGSDNPDDLIYG